METLILNIQDAVSGPETILSILVFSAVVLLVLGGGAMLAGGNPVQRRLQSRVRRSATMAAGGAPLRRDGGKSVLRRLDAAVGTSDDEKLSRIRKKLVQAGYASSSAVNIFFLSRILLALFIPVTVLVAVPVFAGSLPTDKLLLVGMGSVIAGFYLPVMFIRHKIDRRQLDAREGFPDALDMLLVCVEAGLSLAAALNRVGAEIGQARPLLGHHFKLVAQEMQAGKSRENALRNMADRIGIEEVRSLVTLLLQSDALGTSISQSLRVHAEEMRKMRLLRAEERANKLPAKMAIPLVLFILPCLMSVIMTPVIIRVYRSFSAAGGGN